MAKTKQLTPEQLQEAIKTLSLEDKLAIFHNLKLDIDAEEKAYAAKLDQILNAKEKMNGK